MSARDKRKKKKTKTKQRHIPWPRGLPSRVNCAALEEIRSRQKQNRVTFWASDFPQKGRQPSATHLTKETTPQPDISMRIGLPHFGTTTYDFGTPGAGLPARTSLGLKKSCRYIRLLPDETCFGPLSTDKGPKRIIPTRRGLHPIFFNSNTTTRNSWGKCRTPLFNQYSPSLTC
jgi:hypothetical protein